MIERREVELVGGPLDGVQKVYEVIDGWVAARHNGVQQDYYSGRTASGQGGPLICYHDSHPEGLMIGIERMISVVRS
jgi:hypothetical protein